MKCKHLLRYGRPELPSNNHISLKLENNTQTWRFLLHMIRALYDHTVIVCDSYNEVSQRRWIMEKLMQQIPSYTSIDPKTPSVLSMLT